MLQKLLKKFRKVPDTKYAEPALMNAYARLPVSFVRGEGSTLWDVEGREYLDALGGIAVTFLGHSHPKLAEAISLQANTLLHTSNLFHIQAQAELGKEFCAISGMDKVFFGNSGAEANETAIKIARLHGRRKKIELPTIVTMHHSFHGRTMATLSASGSPAIQKGFGPLVSEFIHVDYNNIGAIQTHQGNPDVVAVMLEPIQGEGGILVPDDGYMAEVRALCDAQGWLMIMDEIQAGMGRTGKWFGHQHDGVVPDIITCAKALGNGIPIGVCAARGPAAELISPGSHGTTFGGSPFATKVGLTVLNIIKEEGLVERAGEIGAFLKKQLQQKLGATEVVVDIRGRGLMLGVELDQVYPGLAQKFLDVGLIVNITGGGKVIRLLPSVLLSETQARQIADTLHTVITAL